MVAPVKPDPATEAAEGPQRTALESAIADALARKKDTGSILPEEKPDEEAAETTEEDTEDKTGDDAEKAEDKTDETEDGCEHSESKGGEEAESGSEEVDPELVVALPGRREGEESLEIVVENKEVAERLRQLNNGFERGEQIREREEVIARDQQQIEELEVFISTDPVGFIETNVPKDVSETVALSLVMQHMASKSFTDRLVPALQDEKERRTLTAELKAERAEAKGRLQEVIEVRRFAKVQAKTIRDTIELMVPDTEGFSGDRREAIKGTLEKAVGATIREKKIAEIKPEDLPVILLEPLRAAGIDPTAAGQAIKSGKRNTDSQVGSKTPPKKKVKQPTPKELKQSSAKRKKAAASAPPGAAAPAARPKLPQGQNLEDRFAEVKKRGGLGAALSGST